MDVGQINGFVAKKNKPEFDVMSIHCSRSSYLFDASDETPTNTHPYKRKLATEIAA